jgi:hypothetical protein
MEDPDRTKNIDKVIEAVAQNNLQAAAKSLNALARTSTHGLPSRFLAETTTAIESGNWSSLGHLFRDRQFIGDRGRFLLVGFYTARRLGKNITALSAIYGQVIPHPPLVHEPDIAHALFGELRQPIPVVLPVRVFASAGLIGDESGEAFVVPDGWSFLGSAEGPALNDMGEQRRRFLQSGQRCICSIFEPESAEILLGALAEEEAGILTQHREYQLHDVAHACGIGLKTKLADDLLTSPWYRAVEEWRADGVAFEIAARLLPEREAAMLVSSNFCVRFGVDAHRTGSVERDTDVNASLLTFSCLLENGSIEIGPSGHLAFVNATPRGLVQAVELMRAETVALTRKELKLSCPQGIWQLYGSIPLHRAASVLFKGHVVTPCHGMFATLQ